MPTSVDLSDNTRELLAERASRSSLALPPSDVTDEVSVLLGTALELPVLRNVDLHEDGSGSEGWGRAGRWREACKEVDRYKQTNKQTKDYSSTSIINHSLHLDFCLFVKI